MENQTEFDEVKKIEQQQPEKESVVARLKAAHVLALDLIRAEKDFRFYLEGINVKPHPVLPGVILTATNGHMVVFIHDESGTASREFTVRLSKQIINACKIKGVVDGSEWVEIYDSELSVVKAGKYSSNDQMGLPGVEKPNVEAVNGIFGFDEIECKYPDAASEVVPDLSEYNALPGGNVSINLDYLSKVQKAFVLATGHKGAIVNQSFKSADDAVFISSSSTDKFCGLIMPRRVDEFEVALPEFLETIKSEKINYQT